MNSCVDCYCRTTLHGFNCTAADAIRLWHDAREAYKASIAGGKRVACGSDMQKESATISEQAAQLSVQFQADATIQGLAGKEVWGRSWKTT
jgi:hypothetical protein